jgi:hypothetical protein
VALGVGDAVSVGVGVSVGLLVTVTNSVAVVPQGDWVVISRVAVLVGRFFTELPTHNTINPNR